MIEGIEEGGCKPGFFPSQGGGHEGIEHTISSLFGWAYFLCWSACFYPQIILNYRRKSVVGFHFDFLCLNLIGEKSFLLSFFFKKKRISSKSFL